MNNVSGIYEILNTVNGKRYIGSTSRVKNRLREHYRDLANGEHHSVALQRAWYKYGETAFKFQLLQPCSKEQLLFQEQRALHGFLPEYNIALVAGAPMTGRKHSTESKAKISSALVGNTYAIGNVMSAEVRAHLSAVKKGKPKTAEHRAKIGAWHRGKIVTEETRAKMRGNKNGLGHKKSPEAIERSVAAKRGVARTPEHKANMRRGIVAAKARRLAAC